MRVPLRSSLLSVAALVLATALPPNYAVAQTQTHIDDPMLKAMQAELERVLKNADELMYGTKRAGKGRCVTRLGAA